MAQGNYPADVHSRCLKLTLNYLKSTPKETAGPLKWPTELIPFLNKSTLVNGLTCTCCPPTQINLLNYLLLTLNNLGSCKLLAPVQNLYNSNANMSLNVSPIRVLMSSVPRESWIYFNYEALYWKINHTLKRLGVYALHRMHARLSKKKTPLIGVDLSN